MHVVAFKIVYMNSVIKKIPHKGDIETLNRADSKTHTKKKCPVGQFSEECTLFICVICDD